MRKLYNKLGKGNKMFIGKARGLFPKKEGFDFEVTETVEGPGGMYYVIAGDKSILCTKEGIVLAECLNYLGRDGNKHSKVDDFFEVCKGKESVGAHEFYVLTKVAKEVASDPKLLEKIPACVFKYFPRLINDVLDALEANALDILNGLEDPAKIETHAKETKEKVEYVRTTFEEKYNAIKKADKQIKEAFVDDEVEQGIETK